MASAMPRNETPQRTAGKRPLRALTPQEKLDAIKRVHEGESKASVARDIGVPESTLRGWCKAEHKIVSQVNTMKNSAHYERLSSPSESDRSTPGSSSRPPSANLTSAPSTSKESSEEAEPPVKRLKVEPTDIPSTSTNTGMYYDAATSQSLITSYLYSLISQPALKSAFLEHQVMLNNKALLSSMSNTASLTGLDSGFSTAGYSNNAVSLAMMGNSMLPQRDLNNGKRRHRALNMSSLTNHYARTAPKRQSLSPTTERENSLPLTVPSTSSGMINGNHTATTPAMSKPDGKHINNIAQQLLKQKEEQQQQQPQPQPQAQPNNLSRNPELVSQWVNNRLPMRALDGQPVPGNSVNNNNNNMHRNNNESTNFSRKSNFGNHLPPGIHEAADHGAKFVNWLQKHGSVFTFRQVKPVESAVEQLHAWIKSKEIKSENKSNSMS